MNLKIALPVLTLMAFSTCSCSSGDIEGIVRFRGAPAEGAQVSLGDLTAVTNSAGQFSFTAVPAGSQTLRAELPLEEDQFVAAHQSVEVGWSTPDITIELPDSIEVSVAALTAGTVTLRWTPTTSLDFQEYQVLRTPLVGIPAALIHTEPCINDVTYYDDGDIPGKKLPINNDFFYTVVAVDSLGLIARSNILRVRIPPRDTPTLPLRHRSEDDARHANGAQVGGLCWDGKALRLANWTDTGEDDDPRNVCISYIEFTTDTTSERIDWNYGYGWTNPIACYTLEPW